MDPGGCSQRHANNHPSIPLVSPPFLTYLCFTLIILHWAFIFTFFIILTVPYWHDTLHPEVTDFFLPQTDSLYINDHQLDTDKLE
jgi:hypothetical protein